MGLIRGQQAGLYSDEMTGPKTHCKQVTKVKLQGVCVCGKGRPATCYPCKCGNK